MPLSIQLYDFSGDFVPDSFEALVIFLSLVAIAVLALINSHQFRDPYAELEAQAVKFSHKKPPTSPSAIPGKPGT